MVSPLLSPSAANATNKAQSRMMPSPQPPLGFTMIEILIAMTIIATLIAMAVPTLQVFVDKARIASAIGDIRMIAGELDALYITEGVLPGSLGEIGYGHMLDPWGNAYQYLNHDLAKGNGSKRKDQKLVPLNSDYDLYSQGKDGKSSSPLTAKSSQDDIVRANNGGYIGLGKLY